MYFLFFSVGGYFNVLLLQSLQVCFSLTTEFYIWKPWNVKKTGFVIFINNFLAAFYNAIHVTLYTYLETYVCVIKCQLGLDLMEKIGAYVQQRNFIEVVAYEAMRKVSGAFVKNRLRVA